MKITFWRLVALYASASAFLLILFTYIGYPRPAMPPGCGAINTPVGAACSVPHPLSTEPLVYLIGFAIAVAASWLVLRSYHRRG